jgi:DNA-binding SARP family transcriptional activator
MGKLRLTVLGGFRAELLSGPVKLPSRKARALLAYLALRPGQADPRDKLAALFWGDASTARARHSLRQILVFLRHASPHGTAQVLLEEGETLAVNPSAVDVDVEAFRRLASAGTPASLEEAATLYGGDLLEGLDIGDSPRGVAPHGARAVA